MASPEIFHGLGRRKTAVARVRLFPKGQGQIQVNRQSIDDFFNTDNLRTEIVRPLKLTDKFRSVDVKCTVSGGGKSGQAQAMRHGISRALLAMDEDLRGALKKDGLLTRDPRMKERKKPGQPGARKRFQYSKR